MVEVDRYIEQVLEYSSKELPEESPTASAIARRAAWAEIVETAEKEGLLHLSTVLSEAEQLRRLSERFGEPEQDIETLTKEHVQQFRKHLPDSSKTAAAIDRNAPWMEISQCAEEEGLQEIATFLFEAEQQGLED